jgi:DNA-binding LytR/AlgR family response regulator
VLPRARERLMARGAAGWSARLADVLGRAQASRMRWIRAERSPHREVLLAADDVELIRSRRNYLELHAAGERYLRRGTLSDLEERLDPARFARINRSEMVRLDFIRELQPWFHGDYRVILRDGAVLTWTRRYRARRSDLGA